MKYRFVRGLGEELGGLVTTELRRRNIDTLEVVVVPIPLSVNRERWRGYNQAKLIAENLVGGYGLEAEYKLLLRTKHGRAQVGLHREERLRNIRGKFAVNQTTAHRLLAIGNTKVIIVDDVWTTGATVTEAAKTLKKAGFKNISALTVCG
jgi:ComF family protein